MKEKRRSRLRGEGEEAGWGEGGFWRGAPAGESVISSSPPTPGRGASTVTRGRWSG